MQPDSGTSEHPGVKEEIGRVADRQKEVGAARLDDIANAVHGAALELEKEMPRGARYVHGAAAKIEAAANKLRTQNADDLMDGLGRLARTQPATFFGGAVLAGFAFSRFLKSSGSSSRAGHADGGSNGNAY